MKKDIDWINIDKKFYEDGEPCEHRGCSNHITHPCENCGRIGLNLIRKPLDENQQRGTNKGK